jgi:hypothetical protein
MAKPQPFAGIPNRVIDHPDFNKLSGNEIRLLLWFAYQYKGKNNGKLCAVWSQVKHRGFKSQTTLSNAIKGLRQKGFIELSKGNALTQNGRTPNYYAITWEMVNDIPGFQMDLKPTRTALRTFIDVVDKHKP